MTRRLVVLGGCGAWPEPGRGCSGFLLEYDGFRLVLDLGYDTLSTLLHHLGSTTADGLDAVVITHEHPDHMVDLHGLFRARWFGRPGSAPLPLYAPPGVVDKLRAIEDDDQGAIAEVFSWNPLPAGPHQVGAFRLESLDLPHFVPNAGVRLSAPDLVVAYTGDTGPSPVLADLGRDADLFIVEATDRGQDQSASRRMHLTSSEAGKIAAEAACQRLMLTHFWPGTDRRIAVANARRSFQGPVLVADEGEQVFFSRGSAAP